MSEHEMRIESRNLIVRAVGHGDQARGVMRDLFAPDDYTPSMERLVSAYVTGEIRRNKYKGDAFLQDPDEIEAEALRAIAAHDAELRESIAREIRAWFYTEEHPGMTRGEAEVYEETYEHAATIAEGKLLQRGVQNG